MFFRISLWHSVAIWWQEIWVNIGIGNGLLPDGTKTLREPISDLSLDQGSSLTRDTSAISHQNQLENYSFKIYIESPKVNELISMDNAAQ